MHSILKARATLSPSKGVRKGLAALWFDRLTMTPQARVTLSMSKGVRKGLTLLWFDRLDDTMDNGLNSLGETL